MVSAFTTSIGSLPFTNIEEAVQYALMFDVPAVPELPAHDGYMPSYIEKPGQLAAAELFKREVQKSANPLVKIQSPGPITTMLYGGKNEATAVDLVTAHLQALADGLEGKQIYVFLDEPALGREAGNNNAPDLWEKIYQNIKVPTGSQMIRGVHDCNDLTSRWVDFWNAGVQVIAFNATRYDAVLPHDQKKAQAYQAFRTKGGNLCWGVIDVRPRNGIASLGYLKELKQGDLISPGCGLGGLRQDDRGVTGLVYSLLSDLSDRIAARK